MFLKNKMIKKHSKNESGASLLETILAIGIVGLIAPFAYEKISEMTGDISEIANATKFQTYGDAVANYIALNQSFWDDEAYIKVESKDFFDTFSSYGALQSGKFKNPFAVIVKKTSDAGVRETSAYIFADYWKDKELELRKFAKILGENGGVSEDDGMVYGENWAEKFNDVAGGKIVLKVSEKALNNNTANLMHRVKVAGQDNLNTFETTLYMTDGNSRGSIRNIRDINGIELDAGTVIAPRIATEYLDANSILFKGGLRLNPQNSAINFLHVSGDIIGASTIYGSGIYGGFAGGIATSSSNSFNSQGRIISDNSSFYEKVEVGAKLSVKSVSGSSVSAFSDMVVNSISATQLYAFDLTVSKDGGITVSTDRIKDTASPAISLGRWSFPNTGGDSPIFNALAIMTFSSDEISVVLKENKNPMNAINSKGWISAKAAGEK